MTGRMVIVLDLPLTEERPDLLIEVASQVRDIVPGEVREDSVIRLGIREVADEVIAVFEADMEKQMGFQKHGEGSVVPENEQQKQAAKEGAPGLSQEAVDQIVAEGREGDAERQ